MFDDEGAGLHRVGAAVLGDHADDVAVSVGLARPGLPAGIDAERVSDPEAGTLADEQDDDVGADDGVEVVDDPDPAVADEERVTEGQSGRAEPREVLSRLLVTAAAESPSPTTIWTLGFFVQRDPIVALASSVSRRPRSGRSRNSSWVVTWVCTANIPKRSNNA